MGFYLSDCDLEDLKSQYFPWGVCPRPPNTYSSPSPPFLDRTLVSQLWPLLCTCNVLFKPTLCDTWWVWCNFGYSHFVYKKLIRPWAKERKKTVLHFCSTKGKLNCLDACLSVKKYFGRVGEWCNLVFSRWNGKMGAGKMALIHLMQVTNMPELVGILGAVKTYLI